MEEMKSYDGMEELNAFRVKEPQMQGAGSYSLGRIVCGHVFAGKEPTDVAAHGRRSQSICLREAVWGSEPFV